MKTNIVVWMLMGAVGLLAGCGAREPGAQPEAVETPVKSAPASPVPSAPRPGVFMKIASPALPGGKSIPTKYTCDGENVSPPLQFADIPAAAKSLVLTMDDPDAPKGMFTHWLVWNIPPSVRAVPEGAQPPGVVGKNDFGELGYRGPCPPSGTHRYWLHLYALSTTLDLPAGATRAELDAAMAEHIIATKIAHHTYSRKQGAKRPGR